MAASNLAWYVSRTKWLLTNDCRTPIPTCHYPNLCSASYWLKQITSRQNQQEAVSRSGPVTLHKYGIPVLVLRRHFERKLVVELRNVGCVLRLHQTPGTSRLGTLVSHAGFWVIFVTQRPSPKEDFYLYTFSFEVARWVTRKQQLRRRLWRPKILFEQMTSAL